jgi:DNA-directed RNA polymerase subunit RPC12/RpoP
MKAKKAQMKKVIQKKVVKKQVKPVKKARPAKVVRVKAAAKKQKKQIVKKKQVTQEKKMQKKETPKKANREDINYIEVAVKCAECGKEVRIVTLEGSDNSEYLCQKCSSGEFFEEDDEA